MGKMKVKVYFYHLFILTVVMLLCFYLMYRDMKRIETNMVNLYQRCNNLDKLLSSPPQNNMSSNSNNAVVENDTDLQNIYDTIEKSMDNNIQEGSETTDENDDINDDDKHDNVDNDGEADESDTSEVEDIEIEDNEDNSNETNDEENNNEEDDVKELLQKVIMVNNDDNNGGDDDVDELLQSIDNENVDLSTLSETELLSKTNNELKEYLKKIGKSATGNKEQLVKNILG